MSDNMYIEVSDACVYHCTTCPKGYRMPNKCAAHITADDVVDKINMRIDRSPIRSVTLSGGEPLLNPELPAIMDRLVSMNIFITLLSNLYQVKGTDWAEKLAQYKKHLHVVTALHSCIDREHDAITGITGSFAHSVEAIDSLCDKGVHVTIKIILNDETCGRLNSMFEFITGKWGKAVSLDLCGLDLCGLPNDRKGSVPIHFPTEAILIDDFLSKAELYYKEELDRYIQISEYPLCSVDPYYWRLVRRGAASAAAHISNHKLHVTNEPMKENRCYPHAHNCDKCKAKSICPGIWYSIYQYYGEQLVQPYQ